MRKLIILFLTSLLFAGAASQKLIPLGYPLPVSAHVLVTDGSIGATLHVDPEDDPITNSPSTFFFDIKDKTGKFNANACVCSADILENGKPIFSYDFPSDASLNFSFSFPKKDVYTVRLLGKPVNENEFQTFSLSYDIRVDRDGDAPKNKSSVNFFYYLGTVGILIGGVILFRKQLLNSFFKGK